jgi:plasmid stabilization system protein ParE
MTVRTIAPHRHAIADVHDIICYYREQAGIAVAENFAIEIDEAYARLKQHPNIGSPRLALELDIQDETSPKKCYLAKGFNKDRRPQNLIRFRPGPPLNL